MDNSNQLEKVIKLFKTKSYLNRMGTKAIATRFHLNFDDVIKARRIINNIHVPKILIFDIETAPSRAYVWSRWKQNIYSEQVISEWFMLCWSAKWLNKDTMYSEVLTPEEAYNEDDSRIVKKLWTIINEADIVVAHNGNSFDVPKMNTRFILCGLPPAKPYKQIDTKVIAAKQFSFSSNKLDDLATYFGIPNKDETDFGLWVRCLKGEEKALLYMQKYNKKDVEILEQIYLKLRPWANNHPNLGLYIESNNMVCPHCGSSDLLPDNSYSYTSVSKFKVMRCNSCGAIARVRENSYPKNKRKQLITSVA